MLFPLTTNDRANKKSDMKSHAITLQKGRKNGGNPPDLILNIYSFVRVFR
jgi:hypothetical protein